MQFEHPKRPSPTLVITLIKDNNEAILEIEKKTPTKASKGFRFKASFLNQIQQDSKITELE